MLASPPSPEPGKLLKAERKRLRLSTRDVERLSHEIARKYNNPEYDLSHNWLTDIENGRFTPSVYKLYSLSLIYRRDWDDMPVPPSFSSPSMKGTAQRHTESNFA